MQTKYPIVLVHGMALKDWHFIKSFGEIDRILRIQGYHVYKAKIDGFGTIETNAMQLKEEILKILAKEGVEKVNIIAHSKGGLDSKYLITNLNMEDKIASLTTLCTPHQGSPIATNILRAPRWILKIIAFFIDTFFRIFGDKHPNSLKVCEELKRSENIAIETLNISRKTYCQSFSSSMEKITDDWVQAIPLAFSRYFEKGVDTDGLVPHDSAIFGVYKGNCADGSYSHSQITDWMLPKKKKDKLYHFYSALCEELVYMGF